MAQEKPLLETPQSTMKTSWVKWLFLFMLNFVGLGYNFGNNVPSAISADIQSYRNLSTFELNNLNSFYAYPNAIIPFLGGMLMDKIGMRSSAIIFTVGNALGFVFWVIAGYNK